MNATTTTLLGSSSHYDKNCSGIAHHEVGKTWTIMARVVAVLHRSANKVVARVTPETSFHDFAYPLTNTSYFLGHPVQWFQALVAGNSSLNVSHLMGSPAAPSGGRRSLLAQKWGIGCYTSAFPVMCATGCFPPGWSCSNLAIIPATGTCHEGDGSPGASLVPQLPLSPPAVALTSAAQWPTYASPKSRRSKLRVTRGTTLPLASALRPAVLRAPTAAATRLAPACATAASCESATLPGSLQPLTDEPLHGCVSGRDVKRGRPVHLLFALPRGLRQCCGRMHGDHRLNLP